MVLSDLAGRSKRRYATHVCHSIRNRGLKPPATGIRSLRDQ